MGQGSARCVEGWGAAERIVWRRGTSFGIAEERYCVAESYKGGAAVVKRETSPPPAGWTFPLPEWEHRRRGDRFPRRGRSLRKRGRTLSPEGRGFQRGIGTLPFEGWPPPREIATQPSLFAAQPSRIATRPRRLRRSPTEGAPRPSEGAPRPGEGSPAQARAARAPARAVTQFPGAGAAPGRAEAALPRAR